MKLSRLHRIILYVSFVALFTTGALKALYQYIIQPGGPLTPDYSELEQLFLTSHGVIAPIFLLVLGSLFPVHMRKGWAANRNRASGTLLLGVHAILILSGIGLYYASHEQVRDFASLAHLWLGLGVPLILFAHVRLGHQD